MSKKGPIELDYARPSPLSPDLPAYKRYPVGQLVLRFALAMLLAATILIMILGLPVMWFYSGWR